MTADNEINEAANGKAEPVADNEISTKPAEVDGSTDAARAGWGGQLEFILTLIGYAVGLGNVWRFPYLCYQNGGGAFLIPYFLMLVLVGIPLFFLEVSLGQFASLGPVTVWKISPMFKGVGIAAVIICHYINIYYNVVVAWALFYLFASMGPEVPWKTCNNWWNTDKCYAGAVNASANMSLEGTLSPSHEYFYNRVLQMSQGIEYPNGIVWQLALTLLITWLVVFIVLLKGINSLGKVAYFVSLFPYVLLTVMLVRGATLDGARQGIEFYIRPNFTRMADGKVWGDAATQICYSLGVCIGSLIAMSSFNVFRHNIKRDSLMIPIINCCTSVYAGFVIFSVLGFMANRKGVPINEVATSGPGLVFVVYPEGLSQLPLTPVWGVLFFFMVSTLGFSSQFTGIENVCSVFLDEFPSFREGNRPVFVRLFICVTGYLLGLPMVTRGGFYLFQIVNDYSSSYTLLSVGFLEMMILSWIYSYGRFSEDISLMLGGKPGIYWRATWCLIGPAILLGIIIYLAVNQGPLRFGNYVYPGWANSMAWMIVACPLVMVALGAIVDFMRKGGWEAIKKSSAPVREWGPAKAENRAGTRYEVERRSYTMEVLGAASLRNRNGTDQANRNGYTSSGDTEITTLGNGVYNSGSALP